MDNIFTPEFWINEWEKDKTSDTYSVHKGFATPEYWDRAADSYNRSRKERRNRKVEKTLDRFREKGVLFRDMRVLEIGCGTGDLALGLARNGARVTALDFSSGMLDRFRQEIPGDLAGRINLLCEDWHALDIAEKGWEGQFDLAVAFMSPGVASSRAFNKMMACAARGCAVRGWASKKPDPVMAAIWERIMDRPLEDKPQSILFKINLLFSMGLFPDIWFDVMEWDQTATVEREIENQMTFFTKACDLPEKDLRREIRAYLETVETGGKISRKQRGLTATALWTTAPW